MVFEILIELNISLRPNQQKAIDKGILNKNKNFIVSIPTGAGKTLIGELALINHLIKDKKPTGNKGIYIVPLKALATEKYYDFKEKYERFGIKVALSIGDYDESENLEEYDLIVTTAEKLDSLIRHNFDLSKVSVVVIDEIHLIGDKERGSTLEILITKLLNYNIQIIGLSATIGNAEELAEWINGELIVDNWRPVKLRKGIYYNNKIFYIDVEEEKNVNNLIIDCVKDGGSCIIFCNSKRKAMEEAKKIDLRPFLNKDEREKLNKLSKEILNILETPTEICKNLAESIKRGVAFHHAGLTFKHRELIEKAFRKRLIKVICSTTTLAYGLNLPCRRVIIKDIKRFSDGGMRYIPTNEIHQCIGRAGRPGLDSYGEGIIVVNNRRDYLRAYQVLTDEPEPIYSKLSNENILIKHILGLFREINSYDDLEKFIKKTFYFYQYKEDNEVIQKIKEIINFLEQCNFIENYKLTPIGKRVVELYINPLTAKLFIDNFKEDMEEIYYLYLISLAYEMPKVIVYKNEYNNLIFDLYKLNIDNIDIEAYKTAKILYSWINEVSEAEILNLYRVEPGTLRYIIDNAKWLCYSLKEIGKILGKETEFLDKLEIRLEYGAKEEIIELLKIKNIGKVRARKLYNKGIKSIEDIINNFEKVKKILGEKIANKILEEFS